MTLMTRPAARERLAGAAFELFDERGYEQTTVDDITERAGLGRTTFFRHYRSKEDVIFPDHDRLLAQVGERLRTWADAGNVGIDDNDFFAAATLALRGPEKSR